MARKESGTKSRRVYRPGALKGLSAKTKRLAKPKDKREKINEKMKQIQGTLLAIQRRKEEEAEAAAEFERRLASDSTREFALKGLRRLKRGEVLDNIVEN